MRFYYKDENENFIAHFRKIIIKIEQLLILATENDSHKNI